MEWFKWARDFAKKTWNGDQHRPERLAHALYDAARACRVDHVLKLIRAGAVGSYKGWGGQNPLLAILSEYSSNPQRMIELLLPVCDPAFTDDKGQTALMISLGQAYLTKLRPVDPWGNETEWSSAFWLLLDWSDLKDGRGFKALNAACLVGWDRAADALVSRLDWNEPVSTDMIACLSSALTLQPALALKWAKQGLAPYRAWLLAIESIHHRSDDTLVEALALRESFDLQHHLSVSYSSDTPSKTTRL